MRLLNDKSDYHLSTILARPLHLRVAGQGFIQDFFSRGGTFVCGESRSAAAIGHSLLGGRGGMLPQKNFEILSPLRVI